MTDYKKMYLTMVRETEKAINILINAQKKCEDMYISIEEPKITFMSNTPAEPGTPDETLK